MKPKQAKALVRRCLVCDHKMGLHVLYATKPLGQCVHIGCDCKTFKPA